VFLVRGSIKKTTFQEYERSSNLMLYIEFLLKLNRVNIYAHSIYCRIGCIARLSVVVIIIFVVIIFVVSVVVVSFIVSVSFVVIFIVSFVVVSFAVVIVPIVIIVVVSETIIVVAILNLLKLQEDQTTPV